MEEKTAQETEPPTIIIVSTGEHDKWSWFTYPTILHQSLKVVALSLLCIVNVFLFIVPAVLIFIAITFPPPHVAFFVLYPQTDHSEWAHLYCQHIGHIQTLGNSHQSLISLIREEQVHDLLSRNLYLDIFAIQPFLVQQDRVCHVSMSSLFNHTVNCTRIQETQFYSFVCIGPESQIPRRNKTQYMIRLPESI